MAKISNEVLTNIATDRYYESDRVFKVGLSLGGTWTATTATLVTVEASRVSAGGYPGDQTISLAAGSFNATSRRYEVPEVTVGFTASASFQFDGLFVYSEKTGVKRLELAYKLPVTRSIGSGAEQPIKLKFYLSDTGFTIGSPAIAGEVISSFAANRYYESDRTYFLGLASGGTWTEENATISTVEATRVATTGYPGDLQLTIPAGSFNSTNQRFQLPTINTNFVASGGSFQFDGVFVYSQKNAVKRLEIAHRESAKTVADGVSQPVSIDFTVLSVTVS